MIPIHLGVGGRAPFIGLAAAVLALLLLPALTLGAEWSRLDRVSPIGGSRLDALHQLASSASALHLVHSRIGPGRTDDRVVYQRSADHGRSWSAERALFKADGRQRTVMPNLAVDARGGLVAVAFRTSGPSGHTLFVRVSRDRGRSFAKRVALFSTTKSTGIGVPAVAIGNDVVAVSWTNRADGEIKIRASRDEGRTFRGARTLGTTKLSIDCRGRLTDGLVGIAANDRSLHVAWSDVGSRQCYAASIKVRTSLDRGVGWSPARTITEHESFGWPEIDARGKTVMAAVQSTGGALIFARSEKNGRNWRERTITPPAGHIFSAADLALLPGGKVMLAYVKERLRNDKLVSTRLVSRRSTDDGATFGPPRAVTREAKLLRMSPNIVNDAAQVTIVVQSGRLDGTSRNIYASRQR